MKSVFSRYFGFVFLAFVCIGISCNIAQLSHPGASADHHKPVSYTHLTLPTILLV